MNAGHENDRSRQPQGTAHLSMLVDVHAHLDRYENQLDRAIRQIEENRIFTIAVSMDSDSYAKNVEIAKRCDLILPTFGVHPWNAPDHADRLGELETLIARSPMLGEIGLDFHFIEDRSLYPAQRKVFEFMLQRATEQDKIVNLHTKGAEEEVLEYLEKYSIRRAIVHWYSGPLDILHDYVERGIYLTVGVEVLFSEHIKAVVREIPLRRMLTETDNPGGYSWLAGKPGMPDLVEQVAAAVGEIRGMLMETIRRQVVENLRFLAGKEEWAGAAFS